MLHVSSKTAPHASRNFFILYFLHINLPETPVSSRYPAEYDPLYFGKQIDFPCFEVKIATISRGSLDSWPLYEFDGLPLPGGRNPGTRRSARRHYSQWGTPGCLDFSTLSQIEHRPYLRKHLTHRRFSSGNQFLSALETIVGKSVDVRFDHRSE